MSWAAWVQYLAENWVHNPWLLWGVGPVVVTNLGFWVTGLLLELLISTGCFDNHLICYASNNNTPRKQLLAETHKRVPYWKQFWVCAATTLGPLAVINAALMTGVMQLLNPNCNTFLPPTAAVGILQFVLYFVVDDFGLYWGHRIQHEVKFLWKFHSKHHGIDTPGVWSTIFIDPMDAMIQSAIPFLASTAIVRPYPVVAYSFLAFAIAQNVFNHSGVDHWLFELLSLKFLPFRASVAHHDAHHKYSNHVKHAKNYAEHFWVWDWVFQTLSPINGRALAAVKSKSA